MLKGMTLHAGRNRNFSNHGVVATFALRFRVGRHQHVATPSNLKGRDIECATQTSIWHAYQQKSLCKEDGFKRANTVPRDYSARYAGRPVAGCIAPTMH